MEGETSFRTGTLDNPEDVKEAVDIVKSGGVVIAQFRSVFGVWVRADSAESVEKALVKVKEGKVKPMVAMMTSESFLEMIDINQVHQSLRDLVKDPKDFAKRLSAIAIVGAPIKKEYVGKIPPTLLSKSDQSYFMLNLDPTGNPHMTRFINALVKTGVTFVGISSLNSTTQREIYDLQEAISFVQKKPEVTLLLTDPLGAREGIRGSFPIINLKDASAVREGTVPLWMIEHALGIELNKTNAKPARYEQSKVFDAFKSEKRHHYHPWAWRSLALDLSTK